MVSKASDDLPEPDRPVITTSLSRGISTSMFLRLCSRAPRTMILSCAMPLSPIHNHSLSSRCHIQILADNRTVILPQPHDTHKAHTLECAKNPAPNPAGRAPGWQPAGAGGSITL